MYSNDRNAYRNAFFETWQKYQKKLPLSVEESRLVEVILEHPEAQKILDHPKTHLEQEYELEENPFFHLSLHMTLREQLRLDRPKGIKALFDELAQTHSTLDTEHLILPVLIQMLKQGQENGFMPTDDEYLLNLRRLVK